MSDGRWAKRGWAFQGWAFAPWSLAGEQSPAELTFVAVGINWATPTASLDSVSILQFTPPVLSWDTGSILLSGDFESDVELEPYSLFGTFQTRVELFGTG